MGGPHHPSGLVRPDRDRDEIERAMSRTDPLEALEITRITGEEEASLGPRDHPRRPEGLAVVAQAAFAPMLGRQASDRHAASIDGLPPVELQDPLDALPTQQIAIGQWHQEERLRVALGQGTQGRQIEVVIVIVGDDHEVDRRQVLQRHPRRHEAPGAQEGDRARRLGPDRIGQEGHVIHLHEQGRMTDPGEGRAAMPRVLPQERSVVGDAIRSPRTASKEAGEAPEKERKADSEGAMGEWARGVQEEAILIPGRGTQAPGLLSRGHTSDEPGDQEDRQEPSGDGARLWRKPAAPPRLCRHLDCGDQRAETAESSSR